MQENSPRWTERSERKRWRGTERPQTVLHRPSCKTEQEGGHQRIVQLRADLGKLWIWSLFI